MSSILDTIIMLFVQLPQVVQTFSIFSIGVLAGLLVILLFGERQSNG